MAQNIRARDLKGLEQCEVDRLKKRPDNLYDPYNISKLYTSLHPDNMYRDPETGKKHLMTMEGPDRVSIRRGQNKDDYGNMYLTTPKNVYFIPYALQKFKRERAAILAKLENDEST
jgi:hypothetical protein